jgi:hypothetical protein
MSILTKSTLTATSKKTQKESSNITGGLGMQVKDTFKQKIEDKYEIMTWSDKSYFMVRARRIDVTNKQYGFSRPIDGAAIVRHDENFITRGDAERPNYVPKYRDYSVFTVRTKTDAENVKFALRASLKAVGKLELLAKNPHEKDLYLRTSSYGDRKFVFVDYSADEVHTDEMEEIIDFFLGKSYTHTEFMNFTMRQIHNRKGFRSKGGSDYSEKEAGHRWSTWLTKQNIIKEIK